MNLLRRYTLLLSFLLMIYSLPVHTQTSDSARRVLSKLFTTDAYNKAVRPIYDHSMSIRVTVDFSLVGIIDLDSQKESLTTAGYLIVAWDDFYLQWDPSDYNGTYSVFIFQDDVWKPDIALQNGVSEFKGLGSSELMVNVTNTGSVAWWPYTILESTCKVDITYFPFDTQICKLRFTAWSYYNTEVLLTEGTNEMLLDDYEENSVWTVTDTKVEKLPESTDATVVFAIKLKRKPLFYLLNVMMPVVMLSLMNTCVFVLPAKAGEKASFSVTVFLALAVFLTIVSSTLPQNSDKISYISVYLGIMAVFSTTTVILTLFQLRLNSRDINKDPIPCWLIKLQKFVERVRNRRCNKVRPVAQAHNLDIVTVSEYRDIKEDMKVNVIELKVPPLFEDHKKVEVTWNNIANSLDFLLFWLYFISVTIITLSVMLVLTRNAQ